MQFVPAAWTFTLHTARPDLLSDDALLGRIEVLLARQSPPIDSGAVTSTSAATGSGGSDGGGGGGVDPMGDPPTAPDGTAVSAAPAAEGIATAAVGASASERIHRLWPALWSAAVRVNDGNAAAKDGAALGVSLLPTMALPSVRLLHAMTSPSLGLAPVTITKKGGGGSGGEPASVSGCFLWPARSVAEGEAASVNLLAPSCGGPKDASMRALHDRVRCDGWRSMTATAGVADKGRVPTVVSGSAPPPGQRLMPTARTPLQVPRMPRHKGSAAMWRPNKAIVMRYVLSVRMRLLGVVGSARVTA